MCAAVKCLQHEIVASPCSVGAKFCWQSDQNCFLLFSLFFLLASCVSYFRALVCTVLHCLCCVASALAAGAVLFLVCFAFDLFASLFSRFLSRFHAACPLVALLCTRYCIVHCCASAMFALLQRICSF